MITHTELPIRFAWGTPTLSLARFRNGSALIRDTHNSVAIPKVAAADLARELLEAEQTPNLTRIADSAPKQLPGDVWVSQCVDGEVIIVSGPRPDSISLGIGDIARVARGLS